MKQHSTQHIEYGYDFPQSHRPVPASFSPHELSPEGASTQEFLLFSLALLSPAPSVSSQLLFFAAQQTVCSIRCENTSNTSYNRYMLEEMRGHLCNNYTIMLDVCTCMYVVVLCTIMYMYVLCIS